MMKQRRVIVISVAMVAVGMTYYWFNPEGSALFPRCPVKMLTGFDCPGCGSQRAIHALLHGNIAQAWGYNAMPVASLPAVVLLAVVNVMRCRLPRLHFMLNSRSVVLAVAIMIFAWTIIRNL